MHVKPLNTNRSVTQVIEDITLARLTGRKNEPEMQFDELDSIQRELNQRSETPNLIIGFKHEGSSLNIGQNAQQSLS